MRVHTLAIFLVLICAAQNVLSQNTLGVKAGYTNAWESYGIVETPEDADISIDAYNISLIYFKSLGKHTSLGVEPGFVKRGAFCIPGFISPWIGDSRLTISYVDLPINFQFEIPVLKERLSLFAKAGFGCSFAAAAVEERVDVESGEVLNSRKIEMGIFSEINRWNIGANAGGGVLVKAGPGNILFETNYYNSFSHAVTSAHSLNRNINYNVGYVFSL